MEIKVERQLFIYLEPRDGRDVTNTTIHVVSQTPSRSKVTPSTSKASITTLTSPKSPSLEYLLYS
jgi:hypothetical protein